MAWRMLSLLGKAGRRITMLLQWKDQPIINLDNVFVIRKGLGISGISFGRTAGSGYCLWEFETEQERDEAFEYILEGNVKKPREKAKTTRTKRLPPGDVIELWNTSFSGTNAQQKQMITDTIKKAINSVTDKHFKSISDWSDYFDLIKKSQFLMGLAGGDRPFKINLDWVIKPANLTKIVEGNYHGE